MSSNPRLLTAPRPPDGPTISPIQAGRLVARLAETPEELDAAQALRYRVFYEEMTARPTDEMAERNRDFDRFDPLCDHLLVINEDRTDIPCGVVGTYRLLRRSVADQHDGFYSSAEYDISPLLSVEGEIMELGRSCVDPANRNRPTMQLLWQAIADYVKVHEIAAMFGCASVPGANPAESATVLSYLYHYHLAPEPFRPVALPERYVDMRLVEKDAIDQRRALRDVPPMIKGYLRLGGFIGDGAVVDEQFDTTDVCVIVMTERVTEKYFKHYERSSHWSARD